MKIGDRIATIPSDIKFICEHKEVLVLKPNGDIFVNGRLAENDKKVVEGLRNFLMTGERPK